MYWSPSSAMQLQIYDTSSLRTSTLTSSTLAITSPTPPFQAKTAKQTPRPKLHEQQSDCLPLPLPNATMDRIHRSVSDIPLNIMSRPRRNKSSASVSQLEIGNPYDFQHVRTFGPMPVRERPEPVAEGRVPVGGHRDERSGMVHEVTLAALTAGESSPVRKERYQMVVGEDVARMVVQTEQRDCAGVPAAGPAHTARSLAALQREHAAKAVEPKARPSIARPGIPQPLPRAQQTAGRIPEHDETVWSNWKCTKVGWGRYLDSSMANKRMEMVLAQWQAEEKTLFAKD